LNSIIIIIIITGRFLAEAKYFSRPRSVETGSETQPAYYPMDTEGSFQRIKRPGREADHSPSSRAVVEYAWNYNSTLPYVVMT
jgi:hypothetical protein